MQFEYLSANLRINACACDFFQDGGFFVVFTAQKSCKLALSKHSGTAELAEIQSYSSLNFGGNLVGLGHRSVVLKICQIPLLILYLLPDFLAPQSYIPRCFVGDTIASGERKFHPSFCGVFAHKLTLVVGLHQILIIHNFVVEILAFESWSIVVKSKTYSVENGGLAGSGFSCN